jgi:hypothetical protein
VFKCNTENCSEEEPCIAPSTLELTDVSYDPNFDILSEQREFILYEESTDALLQDQLQNVTKHSHFIQCFNITGEHMNCMILCSFKKVDTHLRLIQASTQ